MRAYSAEAVEYTDCISAGRVRYSTTEWPAYDIMQSDGEASVMLELWGKRSTLSFPSFPGSL